RADRQVKIGGVRIEPGEIEAALTAHRSISAAAVETRADAAGEHHLVAYVAATPPLPTPRDLREHLGRLLPASMLPSAFVVLDRLPISANGKLDRAALPAPIPDRAEPQHKRAESPQNEIEGALARIWSEMLGVEHIARDDNFFDLGGRSLHVTRVMSKIAKA